MNRYITLLLIMIPFLIAAQEDLSLSIPQEPVDYSKITTTEPTGLLEQANQHYISQEFESAILLYEEILASGKSSAQVYFNLGNAYFKNNDPARAILNFERAKLLAPSNEDIDFNIRIANQFIVDNVQALPMPFFLRWRETVVNMASTDTWAKISLVSFVMFLVMLGTFFFSRLAWIKKATFWSSVLLILMAVMGFSFANRQNKALLERNQAIIFCPRVIVKSSPAQSGTDLFLIHEGLKVVITDSLNNWNEIRLPDGNKGWMPDSCAVRI